jgi:hypothetical protein
MAEHGAEHIRIDHQHVFVNVEFRLFQKNKK